ncbi:hypothetical protein [Parasutterella sp.]|uniref:hypothetical protein n=1 Tax=Parasutterella sp. TaxID=2049037 RepID=UPI0035230ADD
MSDSPSRSGILSSVRTAWYAVKRIKVRASLSGKFFSMFGSPKTMCVLNVEKKLSVNIQVKTSSILRAISSEMLSSPFRSFATV